MKIISFPLPMSERLHFSESANIPVAQNTLSQSLSPQDQARADYYLQQKNAQQQNVQDATQLQLQ